MSSLTVSALAQIDLMERSVAVRRRAFEWPRFQLAIHVRLA